MDTICANFGWPNADVFGAQRRPGATTVSYHGGSRTVLPEGVLPQRLHQEPEATRALLQHARCLSLRRHFRTLPGRKDREGRLLAHARGQEQPRHDRRQTWLDGYGGDPDCSPSRQGNGFLIPTPTPLPPCASAICGVAPLPTMPIP